MLRILDAVQWQADHFEEIPVIVVALITLPLWSKFLARERQARSRS